jgi:hypothetical protein
LSPVACADLCALLLGWVDEAQYLVSRENIDRELRLFRLRHVLEKSDESEPPDIVVVKDVLHSTSLVWVVLVIETENSPRLRCGGH